MPPRQKQEQLDLAADLIGEVARPAGLPDVLPLYAIPRKRRIAPMRTLDAIFAAMGIDLSAEAAAASATDTPREIDVPVSLGALTEATSLMEEFFSMVARPGSAKRVADWTAAATDADLLAAFTWYVGEYPPGGSKASPS